MANSTAEKPQADQHFALIQPESRVSADEAELLHSARKNLLSRTFDETGDDLVSVVHAYERLLKLDKKK